jgi:farnesol dehydrogenase
MNVFVTGATGFIGVPLTLKLAESGHMVHALYRSESKARVLDHENIRLFKGDLLDESSIERAMQGCETVFHVGAFARMWARDPRIIHDINVQGTRTVMEIAKKIRIKKIVFTSTAGIFYPVRGYEVHENCSRTGDHFSDYDRTKSQAEELIQDHVRQGMDIVVVNPTRVYGPGVLSESNGVARWIGMCLKKNWIVIPGNGKCNGNYVYIDDVVEGHILAMEKGRAGERYLLGGINISYDGFVSVLEDVTQRKFKKLKIPLGLMRILAGMLSLVSKISRKPPLITPPFVEKLTCDCHVSADKAVKDLGYRVTGLSAGLRKTVSWLEERRS